MGQDCLIQTTFPELDEEDSIWLQPEVVLDTQEFHLHKRIVHDVFIQWKDTSLKYAT